MTGQKAKIALVVAVGMNGVIGVAGGLPWRLSSDLKRFKQITMGKPIIMGRKTFQSIGKALPGRTNIVITRDKEFTWPDIVVAGTLDDALEIAQQQAASDLAEEICIIGGGEIYALTLPIADRLYVTHVEAEPEGDTRFPQIDDASWHLASEETMPTGERDSSPTRFAVYERL